MTAEQLIDKVLNEELTEIVLSNPRSKNQAAKVKIRPVMLRGKLFFQETAYVRNQVFHQNLEKAQMGEKIFTYMRDSFRQGQIMTKTGNGVILSGKKGGMTARFKETGRALKPQGPLSHNRTRQYLLPEGVPVPFLCDLGVMNEEGKVVHARYDKFRQVNRFLELIEDVLPQLSPSEEQTIVDFGCGKSYLTFAMYYYLNKVKGYHVRIIGLDLKEEVIGHCSELARKYGYDKLEFLVGDIASYQGTDKVDMVVSLHACDVATDYALAKAVMWGARVILSVPCCQHEAAGKISNEMLEPLLGYGILKERFAALVTDAVRAGLLEAAGYKTQILEFIDMEHTPKNLLIRGIRTGEKDEQKLQKLLNMEKELSLSLTLNKLLQQGRLK